MTNKNELRNYWEDDKRKKIIKKLENENINNNKQNEYITTNKQNEDTNINKENKKENIKINLNKELEDDNSTIIYLIATLLMIGLVIGLYLYYENETKKEIEYLKAQKIIQSNEYSNNRIKYENEKKETINKKGFKISYKNLDNNTYFYDYNTNIILDNIKSVLSNKNDNDYKIEIICNISKYGTFFYKMYNIKSNKEYNENFIKILNEMKKIKFREKEKDSNFKITIHNNDYDLN